MNLFNSLWSVSAASFGQQTGLVLSSKYDLFGFIDGSKIRRTGFMPSSLMAYNV